MHMSPTIYIDYLALHTDITNVLNPISKDGKR